MLISVEFYQFQRNVIDYAYVLGDHSNKTALTRVICERSRFALFFPFQMCTNQTPKSISVM